MFIVIPRLTGNREANNLIFLLVLAGVLIACGVASCNEVRYATYGRTQDAAVEKVVKITRVGETDDSSARIRVQYVLDDGGTKRHETDEVSLAWFERHTDSLLNGDANTVAVQYLSGSEDRSRLMGHSNRWTMIPTAITLVALTIVVARFWSDYAAFQRRLAETD